jgi:hypothetical protein
MPRITKTKKYGRNYSMKSEIAGGTVWFGGINNYYEEL